MSVESHVNLSDNWFVGEEKQLRFLIVDAAAAALNVSAFTMEFALGQEGANIFTKSGEDITIDNGNGTNDRVTVSIDRNDTVDLPAGLYRHSLRRIDADAEQILSYGDVYLRRQPDIG